MYNNPIETINKKYNNDLKYNDNQEEYLSTVIDKDFSNWENCLDNKNLFILSPPGSGKTYFMFNKIFKNKHKKYLYICDTTNLKQKILNKKGTVDLGEIDIQTYLLKLKNKDKIKHSNLIREIECENIFVTTYASFSNSIKKIIEISDIINQSENIINFLSSFEVIVCDEIHNLIAFSFDKPKTYHKCIELLMYKHKEYKVIGFTATPQSIYNWCHKQNFYESDDGNICIKNKLYKFQDHFITYQPTKIKSYTEKSIAYTDSFKKIPNILAEYIDSFKKGQIAIIYTQMVSTQRKIVNSIVSDDRLNNIINPICIYADTPEHPMSDEQSRVRDYIIYNEQIPNGYNCIIINDSFGTGIDIKDYRVKMCICNTIQEPKFIQSRGRIRNDIDLLVLIDSDTKNVTIGKNRLLDDKWLNKPLTSADKKQLAIELNIRNAKGRLLEFPSLKKYILPPNGYVITETKRTIAGKQARVSIISIDNSLDLFDSTERFKANCIIDYDEFNNPIYISKLLPISK